MIYYHVSKINGETIPCHHKNIEVTEHNAKKKELSFNQDLTKFAENPKEITIETSHADTKLNNSEIDPITGNGKFTLVRRKGPHTYVYS